ncbi:RnfABCDGE type electron transport complex subunit B [Miniphocaeibacter halophilus]|uniref:RnfABCDGE type electron transport complex subunit B n=1 Tax=Miniphocaeibacter halophilus TaxID=2931922 RepID=A0AC61MNT7_9FIRM|nr:RnfABCDGE type electron transport complex subunit B [Miniphocaeibacter halophilus]QQK07146.1 RnfABCDGE type electron transport complex subunit B [Miniphocaeibacter halophilus]
MDLNSILIAVGVLGVLAIIFAIILGFASNVFHVPVDERVEAVRNELPGANCGACGFPGCDGLANAIIYDGAPLSACPVGGADLTERLSALLGANASAADKKVAYVKCQGTTELAKDKFEYIGIPDCRADQALQGGHKSCAYGCLGCGTCVEQCQFDALHIIDGIAKVDKEKCTACEMCIAVCPRNLIELISYEQEVAVLCNSLDKGKDVRPSCDVGCIACKICERNCPVDAITVTNNLAYIDEDICINCGMCIVKCPQNSIKDFEGAFDIKKDLVHN